MQNPLTIKHLKIEDEILKYHYKCKAEFAKKQGKFSN